MGKLSVEAYWTRIALLFENAYMVLLFDRWVPPPAILILYFSNAPLPVTNHATFKVSVVMKTIWGKLAASGPAKRAYKATLQALNCEEMKLHWICENVRKKILSCMCCQVNMCTLHKTIVHCDSHRILCSGRQKRKCRSWWNYVSRHIRVSV